MSYTPLNFSKFVDTTDSEQRWQIYNAITLNGGGGGGGSLVTINGGYGTTSLTPLYVTGGSSGGGSITINGGYGTSSSTPLYDSLLGGTVTLGAGTANIGNVNSDTSGSGSVTTSTPFVVTTTNFGTLGFQSNGAGTGTVTIEGTVDGTTWTATTYVSLTTGGSSSNFNAAVATVGQINTSALQAIRFRSNTITGTVGITYNLSRNVSNIMLDNALPSGTNVIGKVGIDSLNNGVTIGNTVTVSGSLTAYGSDSLGTLHQLRTDSLGNQGVYLTGSSVTLATSLAAGPGSASTLPSFAQITSLPANAAVSLSAALPTGTNTIGYVSLASGQSLTGYSPASSITNTGGTASSLPGGATVLAGTSCTKMLTVQNTATLNNLYFYCGTSSLTASVNGIQLAPGQGYQFTVLPSSSQYLYLAGNVSYALMYA